MIEDTNYVVRPYTSDDNAHLAVMWNESDDQWPGTFTGGVLMTEKQVQEWMDEQTCLIRLVVEQTNGNRSIVGYGSLWETPGRLNSCYVELLNVHPEHQKRSLARRILTQMIDWATEHGYHRVTIGTWPANLKSVPLYKKVGFSWVPDLNVFMENYIPAVRQLAVAQDFFDRHDWYTTFRRELKQVEDEQRHPATGDMKVFVFRWEKNGESIEAVVDRYAQAITGIDTAHFSAYAVVDESEPAQGLSYPVRWKLTNKQNKPIHVSILADGEKGIEIEYRNSFTLEAGETRVVETTVVCAADAEKLKLDKRDRDKIAPKIKSIIVIDGEVIELGTGLHYRQAVDISIEPEFPSLLPGEQQTVHLILRNRAGRALKGDVSIVPQEGLTTDWMRHNFEIEREQYVGLPLSVTCESSGSVPLVATAEFSDDSRRIHTIPERFQLFSVALGGVCGDQNEDTIMVENDFFRVVCQAEGGRCEVQNKIFKRGQMQISEEIGPPFEPEDLARRTYKMTLKNGQGWARITLTGTSERFSGLTVIRDIVITASPLIQVGCRIINTGASPCAFKLRPNVRMSNYEKNLGTVVLPRVERLIGEPGSDFLTAYGDIPQKPEKLTEQWLALDSEGQTAGIIWNQGVSKHEFWWRNLLLFHPERTLEPQQNADIKPFYLYVGPGDWRDVRRSWQRVAGVAIQNLESLPEPKRSYVFGMSPSPLVTLNNEAKAQLEISNVRERPLKGRIRIEPATGWTVDCTEVPIENVLDGKPLSKDLHLTTGDERVGAFGGRLRLESELFDEEHPFTIIRLGHEGASVNLEQREQAEQQVWELNNGHCVWTIAPDFHGGVIAWHEMQKEKAGRSPNHLMTSFPDDGELGWLKPWFGGIRPTLMPAKARSWPGRLHEETFALESVDIDGAGGLKWSGVRLASELKREAFEGLEAQLDYLTVGGSNVLKVVFRIINKSSAPRRAMPGLFVCPQVDGEYRKSVLYADNLQRKRMPQEAWSRIGYWGAVVNPVSGRGMAMISGSGKALLGLADWGKDSGHFWYDDVLLVPPFESRELTAYLVLAESLEEARRYEALKDICRVG